ncbi:hypothetical protein [Halobacillus halophilus]|uniref:hypothetical protein n=1 Tax=Halobacillus halophilus TaxID=1570 RepID=UPI001CD66C56|nr:hypothetical protein [Halobacillus halophilus]MCA1010337.1 hypothetical protein [Halobacillus halophilus]
MTTAMFIGFLPIIFIGVLIWLVSQMKRKKAGTRPYYLPSKTPVWVFGGYACLLLVSFILYFFIPDQSASSGNGEGTVIEEGRQLYQKAIAGEIVDMDKKYLREEWSFDYDQDRLEISDDIEVPSALTIVIDQTNDSEKVKAAFYSTPASLQGLELNHEIPLKLGIADQRLNLMLTETTDRTFTMFSPSFPFTQFTEEKDGMMEADMEWGTYILYVSVPSSISVSSDYYSVEYVEQ